MVIQKDFLLSEVLWYKIGGTARYYVEVRDKEEFLEALQFIKKEKPKKIFFCGLGANLLFTDEYYDGLVVQIRSDSKNHIKLIGNNVLEVFAGVTLDFVLRFSLDNELVGLEWAGGLPGTIGAAVRGNVGAFGGEIKNNFSYAEVAELTEKGYGIKIMNRRDIKFAYRTSTIKKNNSLSSGNTKLVILSVGFKLKKGTEATLSAARQTYYANIEFRKERHPLEYPNTGSVFKNIVEKENIEKVLEVLPDIQDMVNTKWHGKVSVGYLIKRLDLSGFQIGKAQISQKHSNFIINLGGAAFTDVLSIIQKIKNTFEENFGFEPEPEVEIVQ